MNNDATHPRVASFFVGGADISDVSDTSDTSDTSDALLEACG